MADLETRVKNLEDMLASFAVSIDESKFYTDADIAGVRKGVSDVTPIFSQTKTAYIDESEVIFDNVPSGRITVSFNDPSIEYSASRVDDKVIVTFNALSDVAEVTLSIL